MKNRQIPRSEWFGYFGQLSDKREGTLSTLRVLSSSFGAQIEAWDLPLEGIGSDRVGRGPIWIGLGQKLQTHIVHSVPDPLQIWVELAEDGSEAALQIESKDGSKTILEFRNGARANAV